MATGVKSNNGNQRRIQPKSFAMLCKLLVILRFADGQCFLPSLPKSLAGVLGGMFF